MSADTAGLMARYVKQDLTDHRRTSPLVQQQQQHLQSQEHRPSPPQQQQQQSATQPQPSVQLDPYSQYKPYEHTLVDPFGGLLEGYRNDGTEAHQQQQHNQHGRSGSNAFLNFPNIPGANGPMTIDNRANSTSSALAGDVVVGSPASSYAPSLGPDTRHNSLANVHYPQQQPAQAFKMPSGNGGGNGPLDRRMSSPAAMHQQTAFVAGLAAQGRLASRAPGLQQDAGPQWTPNFSFGGGNNNNTNNAGGNGSLATSNNGAAETQTGGQQQNGMHAIPENFMSSHFMGQAQPASRIGLGLRGTGQASQLHQQGGQQSLGYASALQGLPAHFSTDRRMSVPVLPTGSFHSSPTARPVHHRQVPSVDWSTYEGGLLPTHAQQSQQSQQQTAHQQARSDYANLMAMAAAAGRPVPGPLTTGTAGNGNLGNMGMGVNTLGGAPYDQSKSHLQRRRQSLPFLPQDAAALQAIQQHSDGLLQPAHMLSLEDGVPQQQSMMTTFHAKDENAAHKKHVCPICKKRFTRPSSLTTHIYSHTGEKPFVCEVPGCGRHFSVISNLRRHKKIHLTGGDTGAASDEGEQEGTQPSL